jgi:DNA-binding IclR family transcriptional regulator
MPVSNTAADYDLLPSPTTAKTLAVLDLLAQHPGGLSATEVARHTRFTPNLVFRMLKTFVEMGFATQREDTKAYTLSNRLLDISRPKVAGKNLVVCAQAALRELRDDTGETVQLLIESGGKMLVMEQMQGTHPLQVCGQVGMRVPMYSCAPGKAILAWWGKAKRDEWFRGRALKSFTKHTLSRRAELERALELDRLKGYTIDREEGIEGIRCVAAPVLDEFGNPIAAVTMMAPLSRLTEDLFEKLGRRVMQAARDIEKGVRL